MPTLVRKVSVEDFEKDNTLAPAFNLGSLSEDERHDAKVLADGAKALLLKALLHQQSPREFPVSEDPSSLEAKAAAIVKSAMPNPPQRVRTRLEALRGQQPRIQRLLGSAAHVELGKPTLDAQLGKIGFFDIKPKKLVPGIQIPAPKPKFNRIFLNLRKLHCADETNPEGGADDMILGGVLTGSSGETAAIKAFVAGELDDGDVQDYGSMPLGSFDLKATAGYPKNFYCTFLLVESDSDDKEVADGVSSACKIVATLAAAVGQAGVAAVAIAVGELIGVFGGIFIDEDEFPPYSIECRLKNELAFGNDGVDINRRTGNIRAHGGVYRIGFRWELVG